MCSILGQHINLIRPALIRVPPKVRTSIKYHIRPRTIKLTSEEIRQIHSSYRKERLQ